MVFNPRSEQKIEKLKKKKKISTDSFNITPALLSTLWVQNVMVKSTVSISRTARGD